MDRVEYSPITVQDLILLHEHDGLNLTPWYQRRSTWTTPQKAYLINTIFGNKPVPSLYLRHYIDLDRESSVREVVDGQQRIRCILEYLSDDFAVRHPAHDKKVRYSELTRRERANFRMTSLSVGHLLGATDQDVIEIFGRLNSVAKTLNRQEKRNALFSGEFKQFCLEEAARRLSLWRQMGIFTANDIARMNEVQFVSELAINMLGGLRDYKAREIDKYYKKHDEAFPKRRAVAKRMEFVFGRIATLPVEAIKDTIFKRPPLFFTLFLLLDKLGNSVTLHKLETAIHKIDARYNADTPVEKRRPRDAEFYFACASNPHRIKSRRVREKYVRRFLH